MKQCNQCGNMLANDATYCYACNTPQTVGFEEFDSKPKYNDTFLKVLCGITIVVAVFSLISGAVSLIKDSRLPIDGMKVIGYSGLAVAIAKLTAGILMLRKKLKGLYLYTLAQIALIAIQIYTAVLMSGYMNALMPDNGMISGSSIMMISAVIVTFVYIIFLIMYWLPNNRRLLS